VAVAGLCLALGLANANGVGRREVVADEIAAEEAGVGGERATLPGHAGLAGAKCVAATGVIKELGRAAEPFRVVLTRPDLDADVAGTGGVRGRLDRAAADRKCQPIGEQRGLAEVAFGQHDGEAALIEAGKEITGADNKSQRIGDMLDGVGGSGGTQRDLHLIELADADDGDRQRVGIALRPGNIPGESVEEVLAGWQVGFGIDERHPRQVIGAACGVAQRLDATEEHPAQAGSGGDEHQADGPGVGDGDSDLTGQDDGGQQVG